MSNKSGFIKLYNSLKYEKKINKKIYHYTSPEGLLGILKTRSLFATDMYFLNDASEGLYVIDFIQKNIESLCLDNKKLIDYVNREIELIKTKKWEGLVHNYTISFSMNGDSLEMWNYYTKGDSVQGYNLEFNTKKLASTIQIEILDDRGEPVNRNDDEHLVLNQGKVIYDSKKQLELIKSIFNAFISKYDELDCSRMAEEGILSQVAYYIVSKSMSYGLFFKSKEFAVEKEYRFVFSTYLLEGRDNAEKGIPCKEEFRMHGGCIIPYQKCLFDMESISAVTFSPSLFNDMTEAGLKRLLERYGIRGTNRIKKSNISLRY